MHAAAELEIHAARKADGRILSRSHAGNRRQKGPDFLIREQPPQTGGRERDHVGAAVEQSGGGSAVNRDRRHQLAVADDSQRKLFASSGRVAAARDAQGGVLEIQRHSRVGKDTGPEYAVGGERRRRADAEDDGHHPLALELADPQFVDQRLPGLFGPAHAANAAAGHPLQSQLLGDRGIEREHGAASRIDDQAIGAFAVDHDLAARQVDHGHGRHGGRSVLLDRVHGRRAGPFEKLGHAVDHLGQQRLGIAVFRIGPLLDLANDVEHVLVGRLLRPGGHDVAQIGRRGLSETAKPVGGFARLVELAARGVNLNQHVQRHAVVAERTEPLGDLLGLEDVPGPPQCPARGGVEPLLLREFLHRLASELQPRLPIVRAPGRVQRLELRRRRAVALCVCENRRQLLDPRVFLLTPRGEQEHAHHHQSDRTPHEIPQSLRSVRQPRPLSEPVGVAPSASGNFDRFR